MQITCRTNLDLCSCEIWPTVVQSQSIPRVGDYIESGYAWPGGVHLELKVCSVRWKVDMPSKQWFPEIELHLPSHFRTISDFYEWYGRVCGRGKSAFI